MSPISISVNISRENNGRVSIPELSGIKAMRVNSIIFKNGPRKKSRSSKKKKKHYDDSDSDDIRYENSNEDLMDAIYVELLVNNFVKGHTYYYDGTLPNKEGYTARCPIDLDEEGTGDYERPNDDYDWVMSSNDSPRTIREIIISVLTDKLSNPRDYDMLVELTFDV